MVLLAVLEAVVGEGGYVRGTFVEEFIPPVDIFLVGIVKREVHKLAAVLHGVEIGSDRVHSYVIVGILVGLECNLAETALCLKHFHLNFYPLDGKIGFRITGDRCNQAQGR